MKHTATSLKSLKVAELKELCTQSNLPSTGKKEELVARLIENDSQVSEPTNSSNGITNPTQTNTTADNNFSDASGLESVPGSDNPQASEKGAEVKNEINLITSGAVSSPTSVTENGVNKENGINNGTASKKSNSLSSLTDSERARLRAEKFGIVSKNTSSPQGETKDDEEKRLKRAEKFSSTDSSVKKAKAPQPKSEIGHQLASSLSAIASISAEEKLRLRAERFGVSSSSFIKPKVTSPSAGAKDSKDSPKSATSEDKEKLEARQKRFKMASATSLKDSLPPSELEKLAKRAERFGLNKS